MASTKKKRSIGRTHRRRAKAKLQHGKEAVRPHDRPRRHGRKVRVKR